MRYVCHLTKLSGRLSDWFSCVGILNRTNQNQMATKSLTPDEAFAFLMNSSPPNKEEMLLLGWKTNTTGQRAKITEEMLTKKDQKQKKDSKGCKKMGKTVKEPITTQ